ncbi:MAG: hypothetical protein H8E44_08660 [Planctomycetes bacterium]|nr:hypothetical protein [Planctomycetota bacterium]MBL7043279.1 hypothetical protein [Pirellulaceae bacterium]
MRSEIHHFHFANHIASPDGEQYDDRYRGRSIPSLRQCVSQNFRWWTEAGVGKYRFQCDLCTGPDWYGHDLDITPNCPKCGRVAVRYFTGDSAHCYAHRLLMSDTYDTSSAFLLITYSWIGHQDTFPNAKLYAVAERDVDASDRITFAYCAECESALRQWRKQDPIEP